MFLIGPRVVGAQGSDVLAVPIPADPALRGTVLFAQVASLDPAAFPLAYFSAAVQGTIAF